MVSQSSHGSDVISRCVDRFCNDLEGTRAGCHNHVTVSGIQIFGMVLDVVVDEGEDEIVAVIITLIEQKKNKIEPKSSGFALYIAL